MLALALAFFAVIVRCGGPVGPVAPLVATGGPAAVQMSALAKFLLGLLTINAAGGLLGRLAPRLGQAPVVGEILAGLLLGPSALGWLAPGVAHTLIAPEIMPAFAFVAQLGVIFYMFAVGLDLDLDLLRNKGKGSPLISHASIALPLILGAALAIPLFSMYGTGTAKVPFFVFALFVGVSLAITALPVLARILDDTGLTRTPLGAMALACAAVDDVTAWCLLALVACLAKAQGLLPALTTMGLAIAFALGLWLVGRPLLARGFRRESGEHISRELLLLAAGIVFACALATEMIGIHAIFGAFLLGTAFPRGGFGQALQRRLGGTVGALFLPVFFAYTGMRTQIGLLVTPQDWLMTLAIVAVATFGKFGGTFAAARCTGHDRRDAAALGVLMNTRGLVELIALNIGLDLGVIGPQLFTMLVFMAVVTTVATAPALKLLRPLGGRDRRAD